MSDFDILRFVVGPVQTNCYFVCNRVTKEAIVIDPGASADVLYRKLSEEDLFAKAILLTHGHFDHAGGAEELSSLCGGIPIYAAELEKETLEDPNLNLSAGMGREAACYHATHFLRDEEEVQIAGFKIRLLLTPGHTAGGCSYYFPKQMIVFSGDALFSGSVGRTDFPGGSMKTLVHSIREKLLTLPDITTVYPGHGEETRISEEKVYNPYL